MSKSAFEVAGVSAAPGARASRVLDLEFGGAPIKMPLYVLNGAEMGPTVVVTAGIHGAEYVGIETAFRLAQRTDPKSLRGQLVVVPIASMNAFMKRSIYLCPPDNQNLNRMFPGDPNGSFAQRLADWIVQNLIRRADFYIDLHGGDMNEALVPFSIVQRTGKADLDAKALALATAYGLPYIVGREVRGSTYAAAAGLGIPAVLAEVGGQGLWPENEVQEHYDGLRRTIAHIGLTSAAPPAAAAEPRLLEEMAWLRSKHDGLFYPSVKVGDRVTAGQSLGKVADFLGNTLETVTAPVSGVVLFLVTTLAMNNDDPLLAVGA